MVELKIYCKITAFRAMKKLYRLIWRYFKVFVAPEMLFDTLSGYLFNNLAKRQHEAIQFAKSLYISLDDRDSSGKIK